MADYSDRSLVDKLGIKSGRLVYFKNAPEEYLKELGALPANVFVANKLNRPVDFMHCFYTDAKDLEDDVLSFRQYLEPGGILWVSWPKRSPATDGKTSKFKTDITEQTLCDVLLPINLVDIKVCAVTDVWSGLKFVWRKH